MRAVRCIEGKPTVVDVEPSVGEGVRVKVASAGICGSDLHLMKMGLPLTFGHEIAGTLPDGTPVAVEPLAPCGECAPCLDGQYQRCAIGPTIVFGVGRDGGMAEEVLTPARSLSLLPAASALAPAAVVAAVTAPSLLQSLLIPMTWLPFKSLSEGSAIPPAPRLGPSARTSISAT